MRFVSGTKCAFGNLLTLFYRNCGTAYAAALSSLRQRLILVRQQLQQPLTEQQGFVNGALQKQLSKNCQPSLKAFDADLDAVDKQINDLVKQDNRLRELFEWITSVPGIGPATATEVIVIIDEFKTINDPKKLVASAVRLPCRCCLL